MWVAQRVPAPGWRTSRHTQLLAAASVTTQHWRELCSSWSSFRQLSCERAAHEELCHCPGLSPEQYRYHCRELGQPSPVLCLSPTALPYTYLIGTCNFTGCATVCAQLCPKMLQPGVQTSLQPLLFASQAQGEVAMSTSSSHAHPRQCSPRRDITCQAERLCVGSLRAQGEQLLPWGHTVTEATDGCRCPYPKPAIQPQSYPLLWFGINLQVFRNHFLLH